MNSGRHGSPYDRGCADSYYRRGCNPHYYTADTARSERIEKADMTEAEIQSYIDGFNENEEDRNFKEFE